MQAVPAGGTVMMHINHSRRIMGLAGKHNHPLRRGLLVFVLAGAFAAGALLSCGCGLWSSDPEKGTDSLNLTGTWELVVVPETDTCAPGNVGRSQKYLMNLTQSGTSIEGELMQAPLTGSLHGDLFQAGFTERNQPLGDCFFDREIRLQATVSAGTDNPFLYGEPPTGFDYRYRVHGALEHCQGECEAKGTLYGSPYTGNGNGNGNGNGENFMGGMNEFTLSPQAITDTCYGGVFLPFVPTETFQADVPGRTDLPANLLLPLPLPLPEVELPLVWDPQTNRIRLDPAHDPIEASLYIREILPWSNCLLTADATGLLTPTSENAVHVLVEVFTLRFSTLCPPGVPNCLPCGLPAPPNPNCTISVSLQGTYVGE